MGEPDRHSDCDLCDVVQQFADYVPGHRGGKTSFAKGLITVLFGLGLNQFIVLIVTDYAELPYEAALVVVIAIVPAVTFLLFKFWAFRS